tara:strand:+ start:142 stop:1149 length:1008 start_codon:yes stop_codon:yes gene_type:complete
MAAKQQGRLDKAAYEAKQAKKFQGAVANMMIGYSFDGQFEVQEDGSLQFQNALGGQFKGFPSVTESFSKYKKLAKQYGQEPDYPAFTAMYKEAEGKFAQSFLGKLKSMENAGHKPEAISNAILTNPELTKTYNHFLGTSLGPNLKPYAPKPPGGIFGGMWEGVTGMEGSPLARYGARAGLGVATGGIGALSTTLGAKSAVRSLGGKAIVKKLTADGSLDAVTGVSKHIGSKSKTLQGGLKAIQKYVEKHGAKSLMDKIIKKAGWKGAAKILGKGTVGALLTGSGIGTAAGLALDAWTVYDIINIINETTEEFGRGENIKESLIGGDVKAPAGTIY